MRSSLLALSTLSLLLWQTAYAAPEPVSYRRRAAQAAKSALMSQDFPDPSIMQDSDGTWYAFATAGNNKNVQVAKAPAPGGPWTYINQNMLPNSGSWTTGVNVWAPDVRRISDGKYVMYYSGEDAASSAHHCVGVATATAPLGPWTPAATPFACPLSQGGAIDPSGFLDESTNRRWVAYKIDGNSIGHGGDCNNGVAPLVSTPIMLQEVNVNDGVTKIGNPVQILDRTAADGPLVEAPDIIRTAEGLYILFYSNNCYTTPAYTVNYATATAVTGPYTRGNNPLLGTGDFNLTAPGGATSVPGGGNLVFHANCPAGRCLFESAFTVQGTDIILS